MTTIAVDAMGGDFGPVVTLPACLSFLNHHADASLVVVGLPADLVKQPSHSALLAHPRCRFVEATEVVNMDDALEIALRRKKDSSMRVAVNQVKTGVAQAAVSAGNTGAWMAISSVTTFFNLTSNCG